MKNILDIFTEEELKDATYIDLSETEVVNIEPIFHCKNLTYLDLSYTKVTDLSAIANILTLETLDISRTKIWDISALRKLKQLKTLIANECRISDLSPVEDLNSLEILVLYKSSVTSLRFISSLQKLISLNISETEVADLSPLSECQKLAELFANNCPNLIASTLPRLNCLKIIELSYGRLIDLCDLRFYIERGLDVYGDAFFAENDKYILIAGCNVNNPPPEIVFRGRQAILNFFDAQSGEMDELYEAKMLIVGEGGAGKTSLLRRLYQPHLPLPSESESTKGIEIFQHIFKLSNGKDFRLNIWDFGGQEIYHATHQFFLTCRSLYVLLDDTRKDNKTFSDPEFKSWLDKISIFGGDSPVLIFQNKKSGRSKQIDFQGIKNQNPNVVERFEGDLAVADSVANLRKAIEYYASKLNHIGEKLPASWLNIRAEIEELAARETHIDTGQYFEIYQRYLPYEESRAYHLSNYLHDIGVLLHFQNDPILKRIIILKNSWATDAAYKILDDEKIKNKNGFFDASDYERIWENSTWRLKHPELLALMENFELCYSIPNSTPRQWLVPQLLPPAQHKTIDEWKEDNDKIIKYHFSIMPKGIISRMMVRLHRLVKNPNLASQTSALFENDQGRLFARVLPDGQEIELRAQGSDPASIFSIVRNDLETIIHSIEGLPEKVSKRIPCNCSECKISDNKHYYNEMDLQRRTQRGKYLIECNESYELVDIHMLLSGINGDRANNSGGASQMQPKDIKTIKIFLASSKELVSHRDEFEMHLRRKNDQLRLDGIYLEITRWENFIDAMVADGLQMEYNRNVSNCDIFVSLFWTKVGIYTEEEFDTAYANFIKNQKPIIYTYFNDEPVRPSDIRESDTKALLNFKTKLHELGHYLTVYNGIHELIRHFDNQFNLLKINKRV